MKNYIEINCPKCCCKNIVDLGDLEDLTRMEVEAIVCWHCKHKWLLEGAEGWIDLENANTVNGTQTQ